MVRGKDAGEILDRLYPNRFSNLKPGRIRYGVMTSDAGPDHGRRHDLPARRRRVLRDDDVERRRRDRGVVRLVARHLEPRRARSPTSRRRCARSTSPARRRARSSPELTDLDVSPEAFGYLDGKRGQGRRRRRAAAADRLRRRGRLRDPLPRRLRRARLGRAGRGRRARRSAWSRSAILRLQKLHVIVGQDTDSESTPYGAAMPWIVKLDKEQDFIGRWALEHAAEHRADHALVGFTMAERPRADRGRRRAARAARSRRRGARRSSAR